MEEQQNSFTILIADDSPTILDMLNWMLSEVGYNVVTAVDGLDAIEKTYDHNPDLILLDILMPKMNGYQVCRLLKEDETTKHIPLIILTSKIEKSNRFWGIETGADSYLTKDFEPEQLFEEIEKALPPEPQSRKPAQLEAKQTISLSNVLERVNLLLDRKLFQSTIVNEIRKISQSRIEMEETVSLLLHMLDSICDFSTCAILLKDDPDLLFVYVPYMVQSEFVEDFKVRIFSEIPPELQNEQPPAIKIMQSNETDDAQKIRTISPDTNQIRSFLFLPMVMRGEFFGGVALGSYRDNAWNDETLATLKTFAKEAVLVLNQAVLMKNLKRSHVEIQNSNEHLKEMNEKLEDTIQELKDTQTQLVQSEKMASLGQLIAGVAHEINTPAGAINAAVGNSLNYLKDLSELQRHIYGMKLTPEESEHYFSALSEMILTQLEGNRMSTMERRSKMKDIEKTLSAGGFENARTIARSFANMSIDDKLNGLIEMERDKSSPYIINSMINLNNLSQSIRDIKVSIDAVTRLVRALKTYSHLDQSQVAKIDIHEGVETTLTIMYNQWKYGIEVVKNYSQLPEIFCYVNELNQVWTNIIHNAIQAMGGRGIMTIDTKLKDGAISVTISDNGPGMPPEVKERIFEPFFTTKKAGEGTGMGLGLVKQIVDKHNGQINVESMPGKTSFEIVLPLDGVQPENV